jgi:hypothetical protein
MSGARSNTAAYLGYPSRSRVPARGAIHPFPGVGHPAGELKGDREVPVSLILRSPSPGPGFTRHLRRPLICHGHSGELAG